MERLPAEFPGKILASHGWRFLEIFIPAVNRNKAGSHNAIKSRAPKKSGTFCGKRQ
jgi:hypothetical protein